MHVKVSGKNDFVWFEPLNFKTFEEFFYKKKIRNLKPLYQMYLIFFFHQISSLFAFGESNNKEKQEFSKLHICNIIKSGFDFFFFGKSLLQLLAPSRGRQISSKSARYRQRSPNIATGRPNNILWGIKSQLNLLKRGRGRQGSPN